MAFVVSSPVTASLARFTESAQDATTITAASSFDLMAPIVQASVISKVGQYLDGYIHQAGTYQIYANVVDDGSAASGVQAVTADVSALTAGATSVSLIGGSHTVGGVAYAYRSATLTANLVIAAGVRTYAVRSTDVAGNSSGSIGFNVEIDNTRPSASDVVTLNGAATVGKPEAGDSISFTFNEAIDPAGVLAGWTGPGASVVVRITDGGLLANDILTVRNAANSVDLTLGSVDLGGTGYVSATQTFGAAGTPSAMTLAVNRVTVLLGTPSGTTGSVLVGGNMRWTPLAAAFDRAGNACETTSVAESDGVLDPEF
jgi:hypothetical protein